MTNDPHGMIVLLDQYFESRRILNYSEATIVSDRGHLKKFIGWLAERDITRPAEVTKPVIERYQKHLFYQRKPDGKPLSFRTQIARLTPIRVWFRWLARNHHVLYNPASEIEPPRAEHRLPKHVLTASEAEKVVSQPKLNTKTGLRDRAILEVFYSTGVRRGELRRLCVHDIDQERGTLAVRLGKGKTDRIIPIGDRALHWVNRYVVEVRPGWLTEETDVLFLTRKGKPFPSSVPLTGIMAKYVAAANLGKQGSCHIFRHTMATLMLENGASIRYIQQMLGHKRLTSTQIYTRVSIAKLKEIHTKTHPAKLHRDKRDGREPGDDRSE